MKVYDFNVRERNGEEINLGIYEGKVLLIVNSATQCFTLSIVASGVI